MAEHDQVGGDLLQERMTGAEHGGRLVRQLEAALRGPSHGPAGAVGRHDQRELRPADQPPGHPIAHSAGEEKGGTIDCPSEPMAVTST